MGETNAPLLSKRGQPAGEATAASRTRIRTGVGEFSGALLDSGQSNADSGFRQCKGPMAGVLRALELHPDGPVFVLAVDMPGVQQAAISYRVSRPLLVWIGSFPGDRGG